MALSIGTRTNGTVRRQGVFWLLTIPYPSDVISAVLQSKSISGVAVWIKGQRERGSTTGYEHYQVVVAFFKKVSLAQVKNHFGATCHGELSRSSAADAYCGKEETRVGDPFEFGIKPIQRNSKVEWESVWESAKSGQFLSIPASIRVQSYFALRAIRSDNAQCPAIERQAVLFWGATGTGKSRRAWDEAGVDAYSKDPRTKFWDGYASQEHVVLDEFRGSIDISHLLRWLDRYPVRVEIKGSSTPLLARKIWITSNLPYDAWFPLVDSETLEALKRRLTIVHFTK
nr:MAG: replication associated protein [Cressdnaviricota sp.]